MKLGIKVDAKGGGEVKKVLTSKRKPIVATVKLRVLCDAKIQVGYLFKHI